MFEVAFLKNLLEAIGLVCLFAGGVAFSQDYLKNVLLSHSCRANREGRKLSRMDRYVGYVFCGIRKKDWNMLYTIHQIGVGDRRLKDEKAPLRGLIWISTGTFLLIIRIFV